MRGLVSRSKIFRALARIMPGGALLGVGAVLAVLAFPAAASSTHGRGHKGGGGVTVTKAPYGTLADGTAIDQYTLANQRGMTVKIITYGGIVTEIDTPDRTGKIAERRARLRQSRRLRRQEPVLRRDHRPLRQPHRQGHVHARRHAVHAADQQRRQLAARRLKGFDKQVWTATVVPPAHDGAGLKLSYTSVERRGGLSGHADRRRDLHADEQQRAADRLPRHDRQGDGHQPHQPHVLQPRRRGLGRRLRPGALAQGAQLHAGRRHADPDRRDRAGRGHAVRLHDADADRRAHPRRRSADRDRAGLRPQLRDRSAAPATAR